MAKCTNCGATILFGGVKEGDQRFCSENCHHRFYVDLLAGQVPDEMIDARTLEVHGGDCPQCGGAGPIDVHTSHRVWSALYLTSWSSRPQVCCLPCGRKAKLQDTAYCLALGWWGFPWGILATPIQVFRNLSGLFRGRRDAPTPELREAVRSMVAGQVAQHYATEAEIVDEKSPK